MTAVSYLTLISIKDGELEVHLLGRLPRQLVRDGDAWRITLRNLQLDLPY